MTTHFTPQQIRALLASNPQAILTLAGSFRAFQLTYQHDPVAFVRSAFVWAPHDGPTPYQVDVLETLVARHRIAVRAPHGVGKTALAAWVVLWFALTRDGADWKVITTASVWRQLKEFLWPEVHKWAKCLRWDWIGRAPLSMTELQTMALRLRTGSATAVASDTPAHIEGAHADHMLYIFDEAKAIGDATFDAAEGAFSSTGDPRREAFALAISTPGAPQGRFYDIQRRRAGLEAWAVRHVRVEEAIASGQLTPQFVDEHRAMWGEDSAVFRNRILGDFASDDTDGVIPLSWIEAAQERWRLWAAATPADCRPKPTTIGVDIARGGKDKTVYALLAETPTLDVITEIRRKPFAQDTMATTAEASALARATGALLIIDANGVGAGVFDALRSQKCRARSFMASNATPLRDLTGQLQFVNLRAAAWWHLRERLDPASKQRPVALPPNNDYLVGDLTAPRWAQRTAGLAIEKKEDIRQRLGRSTDVGDAIVQAFAARFLQPQVRVW